MKLGWMTLAENPQDATGMHVTVGVLGTHGILWDDSRMQSNCYWRAAHVPLLASAQFELGFG